MRAMCRNPDAAAEHEPVHRCDVRPGVARDERVERVLVAPERRGCGPITRQDVLARGDDVAARAQPAIAGATDDDRLRGAVVLPFLERA